MDFNSYLKFGLITGLAMGWGLILFEKSNDIEQIYPHITWVLLILAITLPIVITVTEIVKAFKTIADQSEKTESSSISMWLNPIFLGLYCFVGGLVLFLVPVLLIIAIFKGVDIGQLRDLIYQNLNWNICLIGLGLSLISFYPATIIKRMLSSQVSQE